MNNTMDNNNRDKSLTANLMVEKLSSIEGITSKSMFGGYGIFKDGNMFGIIDKAGQPYLKSNEVIITDFEKEGSVKHSRMPYYSIPDHIFNDYDKLLNWAEKSIAGLKK
jgi:DNA transformation protein and related proteins